MRQTNFPDYPLVTLSRSPGVETWMVPSPRPPCGVGEPGVPPLAPAVANALFVLTGRSALAAAGGVTVTSPDEQSREGVDLRAIVVGSADHKHCKVRGAKTGERETEKKDFEFWTETSNTVYNSRLC